MAILRITAVLAGILFLAIPCMGQEAVSEEVSDPPRIETEPAASAARTRLYFGAEYVLWYLRQGRVPPILTTGSYASEGRLGHPETQILYGDQRLETRHDDRFIGARATLGWWLDRQQTWAIEGRAVFLERDSTYFKFISAGDMLLARPYFDAATGVSSSEIVAGPLPGGGSRTGGFNGYTRIELFMQELSLVRTLLEGRNGWLRCFAGARFHEMRDRADFTTSGKTLPDLATVYGQSDHIRVHDLFYGAQVGLEAEIDSRWLFANVRTEAALGGNREQVRTFAERVYHVPLNRTTTPVGLSVLPSNTGTFHHTRLNGVFEVNANLGLNLTRWCRWFAGYTFFLWASPIRAGDQVDLVVNPTQITGPLDGPARPWVPFKSDLFWGQGVNTGLEFRW